MKTFGTFGLFMVLVLSVSAQETPMHQLYRNILTQPDGGLAEKHEIYGKVNEGTVRALSQAEVGAILPLAIQCAHSPNAKVSEAGVAFLFSTTMRFDSAKILEPYIDDLVKLYDEDKAERPRILYLLGSLNPKLPDKVIAYFDANLESSRNSIEETQVMAELLLRAAPAEASTVHRVLAFVSTRSNADLTDGVLHQLGLSRIQLPEAINFLSANLDQDDLRLRAAAVEAVTRLDKDTRAQFNGQLSRIASDPKESQDVRQQAARALQP